MSDRFAPGDLPSFIFANDDEPGCRIIVPTDDALAAPVLVQRLGLALNGLGLSRRKVSDWIADSFCRFDGAIFWPNGRPFILPDVDDVFTDADNRWVSDLMRFAARPPRQSAQRRTLPRLRLLVLALSVRRPDVAQHLFR